MTLEKKSYRGLTLTSWFLIVGFIILATIPVLVFLGWILVWPVMIIVLILAIITLTRGGAAHGVVLIICGVCVLPVWAIFAPIVSSVIFGSIVDEIENPGIEELMEGIDVPEPDDLEAEAISTE